MVGVLVSKALNIAIHWYIYATHEAAIHRIGAADSLRVHQVFH